jgi:hypothetical protein
MSKLASLLLPVLLLAGCTVDSRNEPAGGGDGSVDPSVDGSADGPDAGADPAPRVDFARVTGTVWAPGNAPGMVPAGHEIPVFDALVRVTPTRVTPIPNEVYCERCVDVGGPHARTSHDGSFEVGSIVPGNYWLTVEKGQFRIERQISLGEGEVLDLDASFTTLPSVHDPGNGQNVPSIAIATGSFDNLEDVLGKMGVGTVDSNGEYQTGMGSDRIHFYANGGRDFPGMMGSFGDLVRDLSRMLRYHIIFVPCSGSDNTAALDDQAVLQNLRAYVEAGGKLYVTDWSGEWMDNVFPAFVELEPGEDTPAEAYDADTESWDTSLFGDANGSAYDSDDGEAVDEDLHTWLNGQTGPTAEAGVETYDASLFYVEGSWNSIYDLHRVEVGVDMEGLPVTNEPVAYVIGSDGSGPKRPLTVTFEPAGCGRVLYSTYHTTDDSHVGLVPQERILLYLIMEIGVCKEGPILI